MSPKATPLYQQIAESVRRRIAAGDLEPGTRLAPVRATAAEWGCDPGTVARAYALLAEEGLVQGHSGGGTRVLPGALDPGNPAWEWASLVNRAEAFLLDAVAGGHDPEQAESALAVAVARWSDLRRTGAEAVSPPTPGEGLRFAGSHDLAFEVLIGEAAADVAVDARYVGSLGGLMALARDEADVAGTHLWDEATGEYNVPFVRRLLPGRRTLLVTLAHRSLGLIVPPAGEVGSLADLAGARFVNRQRGSGTRVWLDAALRAGGIDPSGIRGYEREERTHLAVARAVQRSEADAGLGIEAAAAAFGLGFVPLTRERYDLAVPDHLAGSAPVRALLTAVRSERFAAVVQRLGGYDTVETGREQWVEG